MALTQIEQGMLKDGILTADTAGRLKMADGFVNSAKMAAGAARANFGSGAVLQVVTTTKTSAFFLAGGETWTDVTGFSASITPASASNKILIIVTSAGSFLEQDSFGFLRLMRDSTAIGLPGSRGSSTLAGMNLSQQTAGVTQTWALPAVQNFIDSPASTSSITYKVQAWCRGARNLCVGGSYDSSDLYRGSVASTITLLEIAG